jgi:hypothetical protein
MTDEPTQRDKFKQASGVAAEVDWDEIGTLHCTFADGYSYEIRTDPLWILVITAKQGREPALKYLSIEMANGARYGPEDIEALAHRPGRKMES